MFAKLEGSVFYESDFLQAIKRKGDARWVESSSYFANLKFSKCRKQLSTRADSTSPPLCPG